MATFSLVHGAWHGGWAWDAVRDELEARGHTVHTPDLPSEQVGATLEDYARVVPPADVVAGHSLGGITIPAVEAEHLVYVCAFVPGLSRKDAFAPGFGDARARDELGRSYYPDPADAARELQYPDAELATRLRPQAPYGADTAPVVPGVYVVCTRDAVIRPEWQRRAAAHVGVEPVELDAGDSPMLTHPRELAELLAGVV